MKTFVLIPILAGLCAILLSPALAQSPAPKSRAPKSPAPKSPAPTSPAPKSPASAAKIEIVSQTGWEPNGNGDQKIYHIKLINPGAAHKVRITAYGKDLLGIGFYGQGDLVGGVAATGDGWVSHELLSLNSLRAFVVVAMKPTIIKSLKFSFQ